MSLTLELSIGYIWHLAVGLWLLYQEPCQFQGNIGIIEGYLLVHLLLEVVYTNHLNFFSIVTSKALQYVLESVLSLNLLDLKHKAQLLEVLHDLFLLHSLIESRLFGLRCDGFLEIIVIVASILFLLILLTKIIYQRNL